MNKKIKVLCIANWPNNIYTDIFKGLKDNFNIEPKLIIGDQFYKQKLPNFYQKTKIKFFKIPKGFGNKKDSINIPILKNIKKIMIEFKPDLIVLNVAYFPSTIMAAQYAKKLKIPYIIHTETQRYSKRIILKLLSKLYIYIAKKLIFKNAKYILPWTKDGEKFANKEFSIDSQKIINLPVPINVKEFEVKKKLRNKKVKFLVVARLVSYKNISHILDAINILKTKTDKFTITILGEGPLKKNLKKRVIDLKIEQFVNFIDKISHDEMNQFYTEHDVLILASYNEAIGIVVPEAMASGLAIIVSDTCGSKMYVKDKINGYIFKTGSSLDIAKKMEKLIDNKRTIKFGKESIKIIKDYDQKIILQKYYEIINKSLKRDKK